MFVCVVADVCLFIPFMAIHKYNMFVCVVADVCLLSPAPDRIFILELSSC